MNKTPNALPPTVLSFQSELGITFTLPGARQVGRIQTVSIGEDKSRRNPRPYHIVDFWSANNNIVGRSKNLYCNKKQLLRICRKVTRKLAVYLFENNSVRVSE